MGRVAAERGRRDARALALRRVRSALDALSALGADGEEQSGDEASRARWAVAVELRAADEVFGSRRALAARVGLTQGQLGRWLEQSAIPSASATVPVPLERPSVPARTGEAAGVPEDG